MDQYNKRLDIESKALEMLKHGVKVHVREQLTAPFYPETTIDWATRDLVMRLSARLLADHVLKDSQVVSFEKTVEVEVEVEDRYFRWGFWPSTRKRTVVEEVTIEDTITVDCKYYRAFPECDPRYYPRDMGRYTHHQILEQGRDR